MHQAMILQAYRLHLSNLIKSGYKIYLNYRHALQCLLPLSMSKLVNISSEPSLRLFPAKTHVQKQEKTTTKAIEICIVMLPVKHKHGYNSPTWRGLRLKIRRWLVLKIYCLRRVRLLANVCVYMISYVEKR